MVEQGAKVADPLAEERLTKPEGPLGGVMVRSAADGVARIGVLAGGAQAEGNHRSAGLLNCSGELVFSKFHFAIEAEKNHAALFTGRLAKRLIGSEADSRLGREIDEA